MLFEILFKANFINRNIWLIEIETIFNNLNNKLNLFFGWIFIKKINYTKARIQLLFAEISKSCKIWKSALDNLENVRMKTISYRFEKCISIWKLYKNLRATFLKASRLAAVLPKSIKSTGFWAFIKILISIRLIANGCKYQSNWSITSMIEL